MCSAGTAEGQEHLDFDAYDFSFIPIETLSVIYQQFLHAAEYAPGRSEGRERGPTTRQCRWQTSSWIRSTAASRLGRGCGYSTGLRVWGVSGPVLSEAIEAHIRLHGGVVPTPEELSRL